MDEESAAAISVTMLDQPAVHHFLIMPKFDIKEEVSGNLEIIDLDSDSRDGMDALPVTDCDTTKLQVASPVDFDPMNLLELASRPAYMYSDSESVDEDDESRKNAKPSNVLPEQWDEWMNQYQWLLHEQSDGSNCFCLYCNKTFYVQGQSHLEKHASSQSHKLHEKNYLAFKEQNSPIEENVKEDPDDVSRISMLKLQRKNEEEHLQTFIWQQLAIKHPWLERDPQSPNGSSAYCNICCASVNVEYPYLRKRHEETVKHREAAQRKRNTTSNTDNAVEQQTNEGGHDDTTDETTSVSEQAESVNRTNNDPNYDWYEELSDNKGRCNLCQNEMIPESFRRHIKSKTHVKNLKKYKRTVNQRDKRNTTAVPRKEANGHKEKSDSESENSDDEEKETEGNDSDKDSEEQGNKRILKNSDAWIKIYPWCRRVANKPSLMFCVYCKLTLSITTPRAKHSYSSRHIEGEKEYLLKHSSKENSSNGSSTDKRLRFYPWLVRIKNNSEYVLCKYCRTRLNKGHSRPQHERTRRHVEAKAAYLAKQKTFSNAPASKQSSAKKDPQTTMRSLSFKTERPTSLRRSGVKIEQTKPPSSSSAVAKSKSMRKPMSMQSKIAAWKDRAPWLTFKRLETNPDYGFCKICEKRIFVPTLKIGLKHTRTHGHIRARIQATRKVTEPDTSFNDEKYEEWLVHKKEYPTGFAHCKFCDAKVNIMGINRANHHNSIAHRKYKEKNNLIDSAIDNNNENAVSHDLTEESRKSLIETLLKRALNIPANESADSGDDAPIVKRAKTNQENSSGTIRELLRLSNNSGSSKQTNEELLPNLLSSSFSIAKCLVPYMQQERQAPPAATPPPPAATPERSTFDLFFESVKESIKKLPSDLVGEGKVKIMQIVCDLELRADQRKTQSAISRVSSPLSGTETPSTTTHGYDLEPHNMSANRINVTPRNNSSYTTIDQHISPSNSNYNTAPSVANRTMADTTLTSMRANPTSHIPARGLGNNPAMCSTAQSYDTQQPAGPSGEVGGIRRIQLNSRTQTKVIQLGGSPQQYTTSPQKAGKDVFSAPLNMTPR